MPNTHSHVWPSGASQPAHMIPDKFSVTHTHFWCSFTGCVRGLDAPEAAVKVVSGSSAPGRDVFPARLASSVGSAKHSP